FTGCDPLGLLVAKGVIEMHFSIGCNNLTVVNTDQGIKDLSGTGWFINPGDECYVFGSTELSQSSDLFTIEFFSVIHQCSIKYQIRKCSIFRQDSQLGALVCC